jgi:uncharacterized protein
MKADRTELGQRLRRRLQSMPGLTLAILYGSAATGRMTGHSDVDVAVLFDRPMDAEARMTLAAELGGVLARAVDLVDLSSLNGTILKQILCKGQVLINRSPAALAALLCRMTYNQADMMPYVARTLQERQERFVHGP